LPEGSEVRFLMIARLLRDKGIVEYVEAARKLRSNGLPARFFLLGPLGSENRTAISVETLTQWQAEGAVEYLGESDDVRREIAQAHCVVLPSYREGTPRTLLEAASMGRPVVTTDAPGCRETVLENVSGFLCGVRDADDLAERMAGICAMTRDALERMGQAGRAHMAERFDQRSVVDAYRGALQELTGRASRGR
jgi:glycosyltransferase involved in cell wall biosynthesis